MTNKHAGATFAEYKRTHDIPEMNREEELAANYWLENTERIYFGGKHISTPIMEAFIAGYYARIMDSNAELEAERRPGDSDAQIYKQKPPKTKKKPRKKVKK